VNILDNEFVKVYLTNSAALAQLVEHRIRNFKLRPHGETFE